MKTLPKKVNDVLTKAFGTFYLSRVIYEELCVGVTRCYVCGSCDEGYFAAWNEVINFHRSDIVMFDSLNDAWEYLNSFI